MSATNKPRLSISKFLANLKKQGCKWVAMDEEGNWSAFYGKPILKDGYWYCKEAAMGEHEPLDSSLFEFSKRLRN